MCVCAVLCRCGRRALVRRSQPPVLESATALQLATICSVPMRARPLRAALYRAGVRRTLEVAAGEARAWRAAVGGGPDPSLGKRTRD